MGRNRKAILAAVAIVAVLAGGGWAVMAARGPEPRPGAAGAPAPTAGGGTTAAPGGTGAACRVTRGELAEEGYSTGAAQPSRARLGPGGDVGRSAATLAASRRGRPLVVSGRVLASDCATPLSGATVTVWQTNGDGEYGPSANQACCYLQGTMTTGADGRYEFETVKPGHYKGAASPPPAHIHFEVRHPDGRGLLTELLFTGGPYLDPGAGEVVRLSEPDGAPLQATFDIVLAAR
jgi:hypothetical protein